nr:MAG TPA: hypothetical protein [Caudoviricetes sp.]
MPAHCAMRCAGGRPGLRLRARQLQRPRPGKNEEWIVCRR